jgi:hypothetical protein
MLRTEPLGFAWRFSILVRENILDRIDQTGSIRISVFFLHSRRDPLRVAEDS